jgi:hypothetical protein
MGFYAGRRFGGSLQSGSEKIPADPFGPETIEGQEVDLVEHRGPQIGRWDVLRFEGTSTFPARVDVRQLAGIRRKRHPGYLTWLKTLFLIGDRLLQLYLLG